MRSAFPSFPPMISGLFRLRNVSAASRKDDQPCVVSLAANQTYWGSLTAPVYNTAVMPLLAAYLGLSRDCVRLPSAKNDIASTPSLSFALLLISLRLFPYIPLFLFISFLLSDQLPRLLFSLFTLIPQNLGLLSDLQSRVPASGPLPKAAPAIPISGLLLILDSLTANTALLLAVHIL